MIVPIFVLVFLAIPNYTFAAALPLVGAAGVGAAVGGSLGFAASRGTSSNSTAPHFNASNTPEAHANPQNTTSATFQPNYHNQTSPTINISVRPVMPINFGNHSSTNMGSDLLDGEQSGSALNSRTDSTSANGAAPIQNPRSSQGFRRNGLYGPDRGQLQNRFGSKAIGILGCLAAGTGVVYYALKTNNEELLNSPHAWHNWKRAELPTIELRKLAPEQVGELMAYDSAFAIKRSVGSGQSAGSIAGIIKAIDDELQNLKSSLAKATWAQRFWLGGLCGVDQSTIDATQKAIERDELLLGQLSKWYANDLTLHACGDGAEFRG